jgi:hypothetical protein
MRATRNGSPSSRTAALRQRQRQRDSVRLFWRDELSRPKINGTTDKVVRVLERLRLELAAVAASLYRGAACASYPTKTRRRSRGYNKTLGRHAQLVPLTSDSSARLLSGC